jgi:hypothetical protein
MSSSVQRHREKYETARRNARTQAALNLRRPLGVEFGIAGWGAKAHEAFTVQWKGEPATGWDWPEIFRRHNDPDRLDMCVWGPENRLCALGLGLTKSQYVELRFVEGDPRDDCPLKGRRALIMLECSACYAQARGRPELRIEPVNERVAILYQKVYGFTVAHHRDGRPYFTKRI